MFPLGSVVPFLAFSPSGEIALTSPFSSFWERPRLFFQTRNANRKPRVQFCGWRDDSGMPGLGTALIVGEATAIPTNQTIRWALGLVGEGSTKGSRNATRKVTSGKAS